jgi:hypothetical protein
MNKNAFLYESEKDSHLLEPCEEEIMKAMRKLDDLFRKYKKRPGGNRLILFCGSDCTIRINTPSSENIIESYPNITCDGGDGADKF